MSNLLDKASVILTPTAYNNGEALCVKPSDGSGDFDFSRNSAATRVNAQGLVENVQILSSNLVQNGDFSEEGVQEVSNGSFSQEGAEEVTNGSFDTDLSGWQVIDSATGIDITWTENGVSFITDGAGGGIQQSVMTIGKYYLIEFDYTAVSGGIQLSPYFGSIDETKRYSGIFEATTTNISFYRNNSFGNTEGLIDNVSVREVGQDWDFGGDWELVNGTAEIQSSTASFLIQSNVIPLSVKTYKLQYEVITTNGSNFKLSGGNSAFGTFTIDSATIGVKTVYLTSNGTSRNLQFFQNAFRGSITNISVKEVGMDWDILNDVASFSFENGIANIQGTANSANNGIKQVSISAVIGKTYKISATLRSNDGGLYRFRLLDGSYFDLGSGNSTEFETITSYHTATSTAFTIFATSWYTSGTSNFDISNISVIEITSDTNLPRISYENFSYQDALGSEEVVNGTFDTDTAWSKGTGWSIANGTASHIGGTASYLSQSILNPNTQYKVKIKVSQASGNNFVQIYMGGSPASVLIQNVGEYEYIFTSQPSIGLGFALRGAGNVGIDKVSVKEYLGQEVVPNSGTASVLLESQSTNLIPYSSDFSQASWAKAESSIVANTTTAPDGTLTASTLIPNVSGNSTTAGNASTNNRMLTQVVGAYTDVSNSIYVKSVSGSSFNFSAYVQVADSIRGINTVTVTNEWQRVEVSALLLSEINRFTLCTEESVYIWGAQAEELPYATSYIPTSGTVTTRLADRVTGAGDATTFNSTEGTLYFELNKVSRSTLVRFVGISDNTAYTNRVQMVSFANSDLFRLEFVVGGASLSIDYTENENTFKKYAITYDINFIKLYVNGTKIGQVANTIGLPSANTFDSFDFGRNGGGNPFYGKVKALAVFNEALTDSELECLTKI